MSWLKLGRWLCVGFMGVASAAACGGRGSLPLGDYSDADAGESSGGTTGATGGTQSGGKGGNGKGGKGGKGGTAGAAGVAGAGGSPSMCKPNTTVCQQNGVATCSASGTLGKPKPCPPGQSCVQNGATASCAAQICVPGTTQCDDTGRLLQVCSNDGISLSTSADCSARGQRCVDGACRSLMCQPKQLFCGDTGVRLCSADGTSSTSYQPCGPDQYCDPLTVSCKAGVCAALHPTCDGEVATVCNADGSGYLPGGTDCSAVRDRQCVLGSCVCTANLAECDGLAANGCETNVWKDADNCGTCGAVCSSNHVTTRSCNGTCNGSCASGYADCNGDKLTDGCEVAITGDAKNCGECGTACSSNHVAPSCAKGTCNGACDAGFADCNDDKKSDGCESDSSSDVANCGGCGLACSSSHVKAQCANGVCSGACANGFADCNLDKQRDGCEVDTQTDAANCGKCGNACAAGDSCNAGQCSSLYTFSGVAKNVAVSALTGWTQCYVEAYGQTATAIANLKQACSGKLVMLACRPKGASSLQVAAYASRDDVFFDTGAGGGDTPHDANGVGWYFNSRYSWGFAPKGDPVTRSSCDIEDSSIKTGIDGDLRLCWHTTEDKVGGGWRCGRNDNLNNDTTFERLMFTAN